MQSMEFRRQSHAIYHTRYHIVIATKYRRKVLTEGVWAYLRLKLKNVTEHHPDIRIFEANGGSDHAHLLLEVPPRTAVGHAVNIIKTNTAKSLREHFPFLDKVYDREGVWSIGYFVSTVGINEAMIKRYIERQSKEDRGQAKLAL